MSFDSIIGFLAEKTLFGLSYSQIIFCFLIILLTFIVAKLFRVISEKKLKSFTSKTKTDVDDKLLRGLEDPVVWFIYISGFYWAILMLNPTNEEFPVREILQASVETLSAGVLTWAAFILTDVFAESIRNWLQNMAKETAERSGEPYEDPIICQFLPLFKRALKVALVLIALIIVIQNRGYSVTSLVAGFGITGLAIGFAAKDSIANVFGSIAVMIDHVYKIGDWVIVNKSIAGGNVEGIVEDISLRSTKIRAFDRTLLIIPNNEMANAVIKNVSRHDRRRIYCNLDIEYSTPPEKVDQAVEKCREIVKNHPGMYDYQEIHFVEFGPHSLKIMLYLFTKTTDWHDFMVIRQEIFLTIMEEFEKLGVKFAFPTQTLHLNSESPLELKELNLN
jgi:MscS family membrane protein